ncbi:hypothetical protein F5888DRAFT_108351 [Russula emetica]|nr:hypothetical protein F5888DRAFT_108351 [Russula emetica]
MSQQPPAASVDTDEQEQQQPQCRICLDGPDPDLGRLIRPCLCSGTVSYVHVACLQRWRNTSATNVSAFFVCSRCHHRYRFAHTNWQLGDSRPCYQPGVGPLLSDGRSPHQLPLYPNTMLLTLSRRYGAGNAPSTLPCISLGKSMAHLRHLHPCICDNEWARLPLVAGAYLQERSTRTTHSALSCSFSFVPIQTLSTLSILMLHSRGPLPPRHRLSVAIPLDFDPHVPTRYHDLGENSVPFPHAPSVSALLH